MFRGERKVAFVGAYEHPTRFAPDKSDFQFFQECAAGALEDAGLSHRDVDGLCLFPTSSYGGDLADPVPNRMADYLNIHPAFVDTTYVGGASLQFELFRAAMAIELGLARCVLILYCARPRSRGVAVGTGGLAARGVPAPRATPESFEDMYGLTTLGFFAMLVTRHMHLYGTTEEHLSEVAVVERRHAGLNPEARYRDPLTVEDVLRSRMIAKPLRLLHSCMISDGGGALVMASPAVARNCRKTPVWMLGAGEGLVQGDGGYADWLKSGTTESAKKAFGQAGIRHSDVDTAQIYDATAFHVIQHLEDLGFCKVGEGGPFLDHGRRIELGGELPVNTDGGGLSSNHAVTRGIFVVLEAVRQLRHECGARQVKDCRIAVCSATGGAGPAGQAFRRSASVLVLGRD